MKLLVISPSFEPAWVQGGVVRCLSVLCKALAKSGIEVIVYTTNCSGTNRYLNVPLNKPVKTDGVKVWYFKSSFGPKNDFYSKDLIKKLRQLGKVDIIYVAAIWQWLGVKSVLIAQKKKIPVIIGTHGSFAKRLRKKSKIRKYIFYYFFLKKTLRRANSIHITANKEKEDAAGWLNHLPVKNIPNAVSIQAQQSSQDELGKFRKHYKIPICAPVMISAGRPDWKKRNDIVILALKEMKDWYFVIAGKDDNEIAHQWKKIAAENEVADRIIWTGFLDDKNLEIAMKASDLFVLISENENFGMVVVEAMLRGLPVIVNKEVGVWEYLFNKNVGKLAEKNPNSVAKALSSFQNDKKSWEKKKQNSLHFSQKIFSPQKIAKEMSEYFYEVIDPNDIYLPKNKFSDHINQIKRSMAYRIWFNLLSKHASLSQNKKFRLLEVGCGPGYFLRLAEKKYSNGELYGIDINRKLIEYAKKQTQKIKLFVYKGAKLNFPDNYFETVCSLQVIEHMSNPEYFLAEAFRVLKNKGFLILATPNPEGICAKVLKNKWQGYRFDHISLKVPKEWEKIIKNSGFKIIKQGTTGLTGFKTLQKIPFGLINWIPMAIFGFFPWYKGESYMVMAQKKNLKNLQKF